ncbi:hypothetical protein CesoFtcFv8_019254 [Champsocephalus esox]|uniref:G-protein coupled receptors family 1 profile domain-containing protein n=1 Tax=Champsocephalus esox TaxID=159716 RepID=A0AAN8BJJ3_9TELE|nr:hypothetical protein CesoFtcFv8_019254 [Champsocephalus esox]
MGSLPVCVTLVCVPLMLFGLLGNALTVLVVWLRPHMRSSTYLYLSSMAVSDLLILLLLPLDLYKLWRPSPWGLGDVACKLTMFLSECCTFCTILHITFLSLERYLAVCWPITAKTLVTRRRTRALIGCLWLGAAISAAPVLVMVGVEDVGREELIGWGENGGWEGEKGGALGGGERGSGHWASMEGGSEGIHWGEEIEEVGVEEREERKHGGGFMIGGGGRGHSMPVGLEGNMLGGQKVGQEERDERKHGGGGEIKQEEEEEAERQNQMKGDEGGGKGETDNRECRFTHYTVTSGLLSAMIIFSNLYFLVPLCILGLVYSLIGRTLWLRPQSSRRDQSHRHTIKMLAVIVLAFVLCWLPFHVGRTMFSLSLGIGSDRQETHTDTHSEMNTHSDSEPFNHSVGISCDAQSEDMSTDVYSNTYDLYNTHNDTGFNRTHTLSDTHSYFLYHLSQYLNLVSSVLFYLSAAINPLLYNVMSARYRHAVQSLVHTHSHTPSHRPRTLTARHSTTTS